MAGRVIATLLALGLACQPLAAAPATQAIVAESTAALDAGNAAQARRLADAGLAEQNLSALQRGQLLMARGLAQELLGAHPQALADFTAALQTRALPPQDRAQALLQRGFLLDGLDRLDSAARDYGAAIALKTNVQAIALNNRANIYRRQNRTVEAQRDYRAALAADSQNPQYSYFGLGQIAEARGDTLAARGFYAQALAADPGYRHAQDRLDALGGTPAGALADPDIVILHPPVPRRREAAKPTGKPAPARGFVPARTVVARPVKGPGLRPTLDGSKPKAGAQVQLGAWRSDAEARSAWQLLRAKAPALLKDLSPIVAVADLPRKGRYYRLRVTVPDALRLCRGLLDAGQPCFPVKN